MSADELKAKGNAAFAAKEFGKAVELFTEAIAASPQPNHVLYSNRSGAYASLKDYNKALEDADECIKITPTWSKGYSRKGAALHGLGDYKSAITAYDEALAKDPNNAQAKSGKKSAEDAEHQQKSGGDPQGEFSKMFTDPANLMKLQQNPKTREYMKDPSFVQKLQELSSNPMAMLSGNQSDPRIMEALGVMLGINIQTADQPPSDTPMPDASSKTEAPKPKKPEPAAEAPKSDVPPEKAEADKLKAEANSLYKKHEFVPAIDLYNKAWETYKDITYLNNRAAAEFEKGDYEQAIKTCKYAVEESYEVTSDYKVVAKAYARIGNSYLKLDDLKNAIENFEKSLTEHRTPDVLTKLRSTQKELRHREEEAYISPEKAEEARNEGNNLFKSGDFPESVKAYSEAIKRAPHDPRGYGNRAAAYLKLMNYPGVVDDCNKAIELDPNFFKAYTRKATALNIMKQFRLAMDTLEKAKEVDVGGHHRHEIDELYSKAVTSRFATLPGETEEQRTERLASDPEIDEIRRDPVMNTILQQASQDPAALRDHMQNPEVRRKINLLAAAGIIRTR